MKRLNMMKFSCEKVLLQSAIAVTSRAVAQQSSIPALEGLLLHVEHQLPRTLRRAATSS